MWTMRSKDWQWVSGVLVVVFMVLRVLIRAQVVGETTSWIILGAVVAVAVGFWLLTRDRYRDYVFEPLRPDQLPSDAYQEFNRLTPEYMQLGCGLVGDFRLAYSPRPTVVRYFLAPDRRIHGEINDCDGTFSPCFHTLFEDGRVIETLIHPEVQSKFDPQRQLWAQAAGEVSIAELYRLHRQAVDAYESNMEIRALQPTAGLLGEFAQYGHRLVWWELGKLPGRLGEPVPPAAEPVPIRGPGLLVE
ncbi:MAG: hypothetical protein L0211_24240 [Planctomycetaceae bacterium]|nr:hypothetical protein [Planctomycetaceae bacterium]